MRLPKRVPFARPEELGDLYAKLYPNGLYAIAIDRAYRITRLQGVRHGQVWLSRGACPHAVESTLGLIEAQQMDEDVGHVHPWSVRSAYAMAIVRFVNGLADQMQTGVFAQSIFSIAEKINLPVWFVELRHAATHEELPSLDVLRRASVEALGWLQSNFWLPNIATMHADRNNTSADSSSEHTDQQVKGIVEQMAQTLRVHLSAYRPLAKASARDGSQRKPNRAAISALLAKIVSCTRQADVALRRVQRNVEDELDACDTLASTLVEPGHLVPLSRQKRLRLSPQNSIRRLPQELCDTWTPLIKHLVDALGLKFYSALLEDLVESIVKPADNEAGEEERGVAETAASWLEYFLSSDLHEAVFRQDAAEDGEHDVRNRARSLLTTTVQSCAYTPTKVSLSFVRAMCAKHADLQRKFGKILDREMLAGVAISKDGGEEEGDFADDANLTEMERSIAAMESQLLAMQQGKTKQTSLYTTVNTITQQNAQPRQLDICHTLPGWTLAGEDWQPTPIGLLWGRLPGLDLSM